MMVASLFAPSMSTDLSLLEPVESRHDTANNTLNGSATQTLMSNLNTSNPVEVTGVMDNLSRVHLVWIENGSQPRLQYALIATSGIDTVLISNTLIGYNNSTAISSPSLVVDSNNRVHIVWAITDLEILYTLIDPSLDDRDGDAGDIANMTLVSYTVADGTGVRDDPDIAIDSYDGAHVVWVDTYDAQGLYFGTPLIYYTMLTYDSSGNFDVQINNSIITPALGFKGNPAVSMGANNTVIVVWEDTRGSLIEYVGLIDSSGSMTTEWEDMCAVFYGGNLTSGDYFQGVKPLLEQASITVLETLYALSGQMSYAASHKNCEDGYITGGSGSEGPRNTSLGQNPSDTTGGIRSLEWVMYNNSSLYIPTDWSHNSEMWGPGSTWACLSWRDNSGMTPGNPATTVDHQWNPNATKLVIPVADEGPYGGSGNGHQAQNADDYQSISEAHDACVSAGIIPIAVAGTLSYGPNSPWGNDTHVRSHMMDLVQCAGNTTGIQERTCDDSAVNTTDAGGDMFLYPTDNMANFEGDFESGYFTNGWGVSGTSYNTWHVEAANNGNVYSQANLCDIGGTTGNPSFYSVSCNYTQPAGVTVDLTVTVDNWASEFSMDVILPDGTVASFNSSTVYNYYSGVLVSFTGAGNYTVYLNDSYGDGGTSVSADYSYISGSAPPSTPISGVYSARSGDISDNDSTNLEFTGVMSNGTVSFAYNVSSEANYDFLTFSIDGVQLAQWSGSQSGNFSTPVSLGQHTLKWTYVKDGSVSAGSDAAWIDDVIIPLANYTEEMQALVQSIIALTTGTGSTETFLTVLNPYSLLNNPRSTWQPGDPATSIDPDTGQYVEDIGPSLDYVWQEDGSGWGTIGHFVLVNDTRLTNGHGWSSSPDVNVDDDGNVHVVWVDGRSTIPSKVGPSQLHYMQIDLDRAGELDGEAAGLDLSQTTVVTDSAVIGSDMTWGSNPRVDFDNDGSIHITWFESTPHTDDENSRVELRWTRILSPQIVDGEMPLGRTIDQAYGVINTRIIATSSDNLMGVFGTGLDSSSQPIVNFDWPDREIIWTTPDCSDDSSSEDRWDLCMWSENVYNMAIELETGQSDEIVLGPGGSTNVEMILRGIRIPGGSDIVITDASGAPENWFVDVGFSKSYQSTTTIIEGTTSELDLFLRAPNLQQINEDQTFLLTVTVTSSTKAEATTGKTITVNLVNEGDWADDDGDGVIDVYDDCQFGDTGWTSDVDTDHDGDGCRDATEDLNDDNDAYLDAYDSCPSGYMGEHVDLDNDGCDDLHEDPDTDGDGVENHLDLCPNGMQYWGSVFEDHDGDGCRDADEDDNDDNDPYLDSEDDCPQGTVWWTSAVFDHDGDGCHDLQEDEDDDNDGVADDDDLCPLGMTLWFSEPASDYDNDGCHDVAEDMDIDNDGVLDEFDQCPRGMLGWTSTPLNDWDSDGCNDAHEDSDDDGDGNPDSDDDCIRSAVGADSHTDNDGDGCDDYTEDNDLDNDGIESTFDNCEGDPTSGWISTISNDYDRDGCDDKTEDWDDDGDGVLDVDDQCLTSMTVNSDYDRDGCDDETEDWDDDGDGVPDSADSCPLGMINWDSNSDNDIDGDGCMDSIEDNQVSGKILHTLRSNAFMTLIIGSLTVLMLAGMVLSTRRGRGRNDLADQTWSVEESMHSEPSLSSETPEKQVRDLSDLGYSPEVAKAIVENEERARRGRN
uniref:Putative NADP-dependent oxidoreductase n=3 Tax=environmental samples TaxID=68359 RepID=A0A075FRW2_9EURY|nr:putative NADP-dependent oxidoreductase [uncultured marine group II/III euryarchaeote AD1000_42_A01]AIE94023.1 putative NADP-dependent oxidoreductase [uncultured marine group II/III euryarchaeote AD1000_42_A02]AIE94053.1 putative NADP-dependent oxidoreductase [uncultured marine group II/III euryarchaeote AD1000_42_B01]